LIWILKAIVQKGISFLPLKHRVNYFFQKHLSGGIALTDSWFSAKLAQGTTHINNYNTHSSLPLNSSLEIGTGWYPVVPILLYLTGCKNIITIDIAPLVTLAQVKETILKFNRYYAEGKLAHVPQINTAKLQQLVAKQDQVQNLSELLTLMGITYHLGTIETIPLPLEAVCLIHSNNTFEHIAEEQLPILLQQCKIHSQVQTIHSHQIDLSDHFSHLDKNISNFNFLRFSPSQWQWVDNSIQPQNRLRINQYREIIAKTGYAIVEEQNTIGNKPDLLNTPLAPPYCLFLEADLLVTHTFLVFKLLHGSEIG
jgi:hypothetical protein